VKIRRLCIIRPFSLRFSREKLRKLFFQDTLSPTSRLIECPKPDCAKKFRDLDALKYHLSYAHNDLKKAAALVAEKRQKILKSNNNKSSISKSSDAANAASHNNKGHIKKEVKQENGAVKQTNSEVKSAPSVTQPPSGVKSEAVIPETPLDLQKRPVSPAYSDISDEEEPWPQPSQICPKLSLYRPPI